MSTWDNFERDDQDRWADWGRAGRRGTLRRTSNWSERIVEPFRLFVALIRG